MYSSLTQLYLKVSDDMAGIDLSEVETLFDLAVFPSLKKFGYRTYGRDFFPNRAVQSLFNRSRCQLTHFDLSGDLENSRSEGLISIFDDLPSITHLKLEDTGRYGRTWPESGIGWDALLQRLGPTRHDEFERLFPRLESLEFLGYEAISWSCLAGWRTVSAWE